MLQSTMTIFSKFFVEPSAKPGNEREVEGELTLTGDQLKNDDPINKFKVILKYMDREANTGRNGAARQGIVRKELLEEGVEMTFNPILRN